MAFSMGVILTTYVRPGMILQVVTLSGDPQRFPKNPENKCSEVSPQPRNLGFVESTQCVYIYIYYIYIYTWTLQGRQISAPKSIFGG